MPDFPFTPLITRLPATIPFIGPETFERKIGRIFRARIGALIEAVHQIGSHLVYIANPDNPTGTWHTTAELQTFLDALPKTCICILDALIQNGVFVRKPGVPPLDRLVRVTVGTPEARALFSDTLTRICART